MTLPFPTRRSSDLAGRIVAGSQQQAAGRVADANQIRRRGCRQQAALADHQACDTVGGSQRCCGLDRITVVIARSEEHTSELQSLMRNSYAVFCLKKKNNVRSVTHDNANRSK